jgi:hypothetical protein
MKPHAQIISVHEALTAVGQLLLLQGRLKGDTVHPKGAIACWLACTLTHITSLFRVWVLVEAVQGKGWTVW